MSVVCLVSGGLDSAELMVPFEKTWSCYRESRYTVQELR
jgi:7-cyano-7-deazaguanine synthase in queuosine biosynthesis